ncbi:nucleoid-associated protein [Proteus sp. G2626]|uniref:nucleoid-associated protein n=1 Tax=Proteus sp. G2626 TaxID=2698842 RepID=UPI003075E26C
MSKDESIEIEVRNVVVHFLDKEQHGDATQILSPTMNTVTNASQRLIDAICERYSGRTGKGYGHFEGDTDNYPMERIVADYLNAPDSFYDISVRMMNHLVDRSQQETMATGGYVLFSHIIIGSHEHILIAMVNATTGSAINDNFIIEDSVYLDIAKLRVAGRIDITAWQNGAERYISFLKGQSTVSNYFKRFLGCNDVLIAKQESEKLKNALQAFVTEQGLEAEEKESFLSRAFEHLRDLSKSTTPLNLDTFVNSVWPHDPDTLSAKLASEELELSDGFIPDGRIIRGLVSFKGKSQYWELKFDRAGINNGSVEYNEENNEIILRNISDELRQIFLDEV